MQMFSIIKSAFPHSKFDALTPIIVKNVCDYIVPVKPLTKDLTLFVEKTPHVQMVAKKSMKETTPSVSIKREVYDFIDEEETPKASRSVPEAGVSKKHVSNPVPEARAHEKHVSKPTPEAGVPKTILKRPVPEAGRKKQLESPMDEEPKCALQQILASFDPELIMMDESQWGSYIHKYVTDEYVRIGQSKDMPMYRKRKQLISELEAMERVKGMSAVEQPLIMNYIAWRYNIQILVHLNDKLKRIVAYPEMHLWRRDVPIYCLGKTSMSELKFRQLREYIEMAEDSGSFIEWPVIDGKKTDLIAELGGESAHLKKDELSRLVGKKRTYDLFGR